MDTGAHIAIRLVGVVSVVNGTRVVDPRVVGGPRCVEILAYLTVNRHREVTTDELAHVLWPEQRPRSWNSALRGVISKVRDAVEAAGIAGECVRSRAGNVRLLLPADVTVDLEMARTDCRPSAGTTIADYEDAVRRAQAALLILGDEGLVGVSGPWADPARDECEMLRLRALELHATSSLEIGDFDRAVASAEAVLSADPLREVSYRVAMRGYAALGDRAQALSVAARCRRVLAEVLGIRPSPDTEVAFEEILREDDDPPSETAGGRPRSRPEPAPSARSVVAPESPAYPWLHIVGRTEQLDELGEAIDAARRGQGRFVVVSGESGTGKTTLAGEALRRARAAGFHVIVGHCSESAATPYEPFVEAVTRDIDSRDTADTREWLSRHGTDILRLVPNAARRFADLVPATVSDDRPLVMEAVAGWLAADADTATVLFIDDLQWASPATLTVLRYLVGVSAESNLCVMATLRDDFVAHPELVAMMHAAESAARLHRVKLGYLTTRDVQELLDLAGFDLDAAALHDRSNGLPLFVASLLAAHWRMPEEALPDSVADAVAQLERRLSESTVRLLHLCSVIGMDVPRALLREAADWFDDDTQFAEAIDELTLRRFLLVSDTDPHGGLRLRHPLVLETLYSSTSGAARARMHSSVGYALERLGAASDTEDFVRLTYHFSRALDADRSAAAHYARRAGESAYGVAAYEDAIAYFQDALDRTFPRGDSVVRCRVLVDMGRAMRRIRDREARRTLFDAAAMARRIGDVDLQVAATLANALEGIMFVQVYGVDHERVDSLHDALAALESTGVGDTADTALLLAQLVVELGWENDWVARRDFVVRGLAAARAVGDRQALGAVMLSVLIGLRVPECADLRALARAELSDLMSLSTNRIRDPAFAVWMSRAEIEQGDPAAGLRILDYIGPAQTARNPELAALVQYGRVGIDLTVGRLAESQARIEMLRALPDDPADPGKWGRLQLSLLALNTVRGDFGEQAAERERFVEAAHLVPAFRPILALALADVGEFDDAVEVMEWYTSERIAEIPTSVISLLYLAVLARAGAVVGNDVICHDVYARLLPFADQTIMVWAAVFGVVHHHLAHMAIAVGDYERAAVHLADARREHMRRGYAAWDAETEYLGLVLTQDTTGTVDPVRHRAAVSKAESIGATAVLRRIEALTAPVDTDRS